VSAASKIDTKDSRPVEIWLLVCAALIFVMVIVGGITRLTESGLSITEWKPVTGAVPPLTEQAWQEEFERYRQIPEYRERNEGMTIEEYKTIYWWEYLHRLLGRIIGAAFLLPYLWFLATGRVRGTLAKRLGFIFILGALQGALGWYMVQSGLADRINVSPYRLAAHLGLALAIYAAILWTVFDLQSTGRQADQRAAELAVLVFIVMLLGAFVAGNDAGMIYNTFPLMGGSLVPAGYFDFEPWWQNFFENPATVQFNHRVGGVLTLFVALVYWMRAAGSGNPWPAIVLATTLLQAVLGIFTLVLVVPTPLAALHQAGAMALLTVSLAAARR
jgi:cytochrome c oxidase assembly protein subunit 15